MRGRKEEFIGERFGSLVVVKKAENDKFRNRQWECQCDCGNKIIVKGFLLKNGNVISCGECGNKRAINPVKKELKQESYIGERFGRLVVLDQWNERDKSGRTYIIVKCKCDCGNTIETKLNSVRNGLTQSCGCLKKDRIRNTAINVTDDFIGTRFGSLVVQSYDLDKKKWKCKCDCGNIIYLKKGNLTNNGYKSCGKCGRRYLRTKKTEK